jgi:hypothetical protein
LSSAILYLAIVAIWACVLIPRWLRRDTVSVHIEVPEAPEASESPAPAHAPTAPDSGHGPTPAPTPASASAEHGQRGEQVPRGRPVARRPGAAAVPARAARRDPARDAARDLEHKRVLSARKRLLGMLLLLAFGSAALAVMRMAAWWVVVPPLVMLFGYLAVLREAAKADAERRELARSRAARAARGARAAGPARQVPPGRARVAAPAAARRPAAPAGRPGVVATAPGAEIIDLPASREDFYDQYADAKLRAVGD